MLELAVDEKIEKEKVVPHCYSVYLCSNNIIEIHWDPKIREVKLEFMLDITSTIKEFGGGKKMLVYISTIPFLSINADASKYSASSEGQAYTLANAVLVDNLSKRLLFNFFMNVSRPSTPTRAFSNKIAAIQWLKEF